MVVRRLPHHQDAPVRIEDRTAHAQLRCRVAGLRREQPLDPAGIVQGVFGHDASRQALQRMIAFQIIRVPAERQAGLRRGLDFPRPDQPVGFGPAQSADSGTNAASAGSTEVISASVNIRQVPATRISLGRKRAL